MNETPDLTTVFFSHPLCRTSLLLARTPRFLRFACTDVGGDRKWDALDQLDDEAADGEYLFAAEYESAGCVHIDGMRDGKRFGEWRRTVTYDPVGPQPPQDVMRDNAKWRAWCEQVQNAKR